MTETRETVKKLKLELERVKLSEATMHSGALEVTPQALAAAKEPTIPKSSSRGRAARSGANGRGQEQLSLDIERLGITGADRKALVSAVQTTKAIIAEHG